MKNLPLFLLVEDSEEIAEAIKLTLSVRWPEAKIITSGNGNDAIKLIQKEKPELVILDLGLPDISGFEVLKRLRSFSKVPVIIVTVRGDEADIVRGLELGANDYIVKPFRQMELLSRVNNQIRKETRVPEDSPMFTGTLRLHPATHEVFVGLKQVKLTPIESKLLAALMRNAGQIMTQAGLASEIWGGFYPDAAQSLKVHIRRLRQKLETNPSSPDLILTRTGVGYYINKPEHEQKH
jgi:two-component system response regulator VicR